MFTPQIRFLLLALAASTLPVSGSSAQTLFNKNTNGTATDPTSVYGGASRTGNNGTISERGAIPTFRVDSGDAGETSMDPLVPAMRAPSGARRDSPGRDVDALSDVRGERNMRLPRKRHNEFSRYASKVSGQQLHVFGADFFGMLAESSMRSGAAVGPAVPPEYQVNVGDELLIQLSGVLEGEIRQQVRRGGDITLPRVGAIRVAGVAVSELSGFIKARLETQYKNIQVSTSLTSLHGMRVNVTGFVESPGPHVVDGLSTVASAIAAAGGPSEGGSYRVAELWRKGRLVTTFDLYELLVRGDKSRDMSLTADDTIRVAPASSYQVALTGSVNRSGVYELLPNEGLRELLQYAGGLTPLADRSRVAAVLIDKSGQRVVRQLEYAPDSSVRLGDGTVLNIFSSAALDPAINATLKIVQVEGEVRRPGSYVLSANSRIADAIEAAGGLTEDAFIRGLSLTRVSLAREQGRRLQASLDEIERSVFEASTNIVSAASETAIATAGSNNAVRAYLEKLRQVVPSGRLVLPRTASDTLLQDPLLEGGDRINVPARANSVSVFGAVYGEGSYHTQSKGSLEQFLKIAGGVRPGADLSNIFVLKPDGTVVAVPTSLFGNGRETEVEPGDTIFVPTDAQRGRGWAIAKDIGTLLYQFGLGAAALKAIN